jgi:peptidoglycan/xylan/chitin deacetylase (PgdA/CDA1 family)
LVPEGESHVRWLIVDGRRRRIALLVAAVLAVVILGWTALVGLSGRHRNTLRPLTHGDQALRAVALTFDVSDGETQLQAIQKSLDVAGVKASFFVTGHWAADHPSLLQALSAAGHSVEASGFDYLSMVGLNADQVNSRLAAVSDSFARAGVPAARFFRPPGGRFDDALLEGALFRGLIPVTWAVDSQDWRLDSSDAIVRAVTAGVVPGAIILLHADDSCRGTATAIPNLIRLLQERGLAPVTLRELLGNEEGGD